MFGAVNYPLPTRGHSGFSLSRKQWWGHTDCGPDHLDSPGPAELRVLRCANPAWKPRQNCALVSKLQFWVSELRERRGNGQRPIPSNVAKSGSVGACWGKSPGKEPCALSKATERVRVGAQPKSYLGFSSAGCGTGNRRMSSPLICTVSLTPKYWPC